jgi:ABC-type antimicrobial peptide transport system permease subunit
MLKNYFITALRNLRHNKAFSAINILGLAIGISASLVIFLIVKYDFSFDNFEKGGDRIYRVVSERSERTPFTLADALRNGMTGLDVVAPLKLWDEESKVSIDKPKNEKPTVFKNQADIIFANEAYFKLINYKWLAGSPKSSLSEPYQTVLAEKNARKFFPHLSLNDIIGKEIILKDYTDTVRTTVSGIVENLKANTDLNFQTFVSLATESTLHPKNLNNWRIFSSQLFIKLSKNADPTLVKSQIAEVYKLYSKPNSNSSSNAELGLQPLSDLHFSTVYDNFGQRKAYMPTLYGLMAVAGILLLLACINFINLTTAQSSQRAKEIGIRKTLGASRKQLIFQFLSETFILTLIATIISIIIAPLLLKAFSDFIPEGLHFNIRQPGVILFLFITTILVSLLSGIYPALILSSYKPITVLKNQVVEGSGKTRKLFFRKTLTVSQFVFAQVFIIATLIVGRQIHYELTKDMGFKKNAIIYFGTNYRDTTTAKRKVLFQEFKAIPEIANVSLAGFPPSTDLAPGFNLKYKNGATEIDTNVRIKPADTNYLNLYHIKLLAGTNLPFSDSMNSLVINEKCSQMLGFKNPQEAIGKYVGSNFSRGKVPIVGVVANFIQGSLHDEVAPLVIFSDTKMQLTFNIALQPENAEGITWKNAISKIEKDFKKIYPDTDFEMHFLDESIAKYYTAEQNLSRLLAWATGLAIFISCLGLLGLVMYTTNQRTKEIGIRKIVGASVSQIIILLAKDFLKLILIAFVIAVPIVWFAANKWLQNFTFKIEPGVWLFIMGGLILLLPTVIILLLKTYRAAMANPVESLRSE